MFNAFLEPLATDVSSTAVTPRNEKLRRLASQAKEGMEAAETMEPLLPEDSDMVAEDEEAELERSGIPYISKGLHGRLRETFAEAVKQRCGV